MANRGFFAASTLMQSRAPAALVPRCGACGLYKQCVTPKMPVSGKGRRKVLIVGMAPFEQDDKQGKHFVDKGGLVLREELKRIGVDLDRDCWKTNALICRTPNSVLPSNEQISHCLPNLKNTIKELEPDVIIPMGHAAVHALIGWLWQDDVGEINRWVGWQIPCQSLNAWVCPTWQPESLQYAKDEVLRLWWGRHLSAAFKLNGKPWAQPPDYMNQIKLYVNSDQAVTALEAINKRGGVVAFDYETDRLKPDGERARIVSASVCYGGRRTFAYPWVGHACAATGRMLRNPSVKKIASNLKFEDRWTRRMFGHGVKGWLWDTMINAHIINHKEETTSIKFQSFVLLGHEAYDEHIKPQLKSKGSREVNNILRQVDTMDLLRYNALDSLLEFKVAEKQMEVLGLSSLLGD